MYNTWEHSEPIAYLLLLCKTNADSFQIAVSFLIEKPKAVKGLASNLVVDANVIVVVDDVRTERFPFGLAQFEP